jgi:hypothetical protein
VSEKERDEGLSEEDLEKENGELLPDREEMSVIKPIVPAGGGVTLPIEPPPTE